MKYGKLVSKNLLQHTTEAGNNRHTLIKPDFKRSISFISEKKGSVTITITDKNSQSLHFTLKEDELNEFLVCLENSLVDAKMIPEDDKIYIE